MTNAFDKAVAANIVAIRALLLANGPQDLNAIKRECAVQAYADKESIELAVRKMVESKEVVACDDEGDGQIVYELNDEADKFKLAKAELEYLLKGAMVRLQDKEPENMAWRLADAAGLLREALPPKAGESLIGRDEPTGRGYVLPIKERGPANPVVMVEVRSVYGNTTIYPANAAAERFAAIAGKKTLSNTDLMNIQALGFVVEEAKPNKLCA